MAVVTLAEVQQWLETTKMSLAGLDTELAESARLYAFAEASKVYDTTTWVDVATTPKLVRSAISMLVAGWEYQRTYSQEEDVAYGRRLEREAKELLEAIGNGSLYLEELPGVGSLAGTPGFYPDDEEEIKFTMSGKF